jgi:hypothetical protein
MNFMAWFDVLIQGEIVKQKLEARGKSPNSETGSWIEVEADDESAAREAAILKYGRPAFIKKIVPTTYEAVLARRKKWDELFQAEEERIERERKERGEDK